MSQDEPRPIRGRGASENPPNRFAERWVEPDPEEREPEEPAPSTQFLKDSSRSILSYNDSPDVGFTVSVTPYRGCEHGCVYCISGDTLILMADGTSKRLEDVRAGDEIYGTVRRGWYRRFMKTRVLAHWHVLKPAYRITLEDGTELIASGDHRFLTERGWKHVTGAGRPHLTTNNKLMGVGALASAPQRGSDYKRGYLCGIIRGDGLLASYRYAREGRSRDDQYRFRLALADQDALERARGHLLDFGIETREYLFQQASGDRRPLRAIRTQTRGNFERIRQIVAWPGVAAPEWSKGFLAGIFDAEGSYSDGILRIANTDEMIIDQIRRCLGQMAFAWTVDTRPRVNGLRYVRLLGGLREHLRFFHTVEPAIVRKRNIEGQALKNAAALQVVSVEPLGARHALFDITTGTGDFIANGVVSHNCYARPTHEYLGFSAGLDFETKILVKEDAPALLRRALASPQWQAQVVAVSGVTDPYQPVERRLTLTRRCLEVLVEFRNPVVIVTKNALVTRDRDLLAELARYEAAAVFLSITTLDAGLARIMEPRTSQPVRRLAAIETLAQAGVPAGVLVAPVIPGLTEHELPSIIAAAARAGARFAGYVVLRLPHGVKDLFEQWLTQHFPDREAKVLNRIRSLRGGRLNDPRLDPGWRGRAPGRPRSPASLLWPAGRRGSARAPYCCQRPRSGDLQTPSSRSSLSPFRQDGAR